MQPLPVYLYLPCHLLPSFFSKKKYIFSDYEEELKKQKSKAEIEFPNERRNQIMAGIFAVIAMLGYAYSMGIIEVGFIVMTFKFKRMIYSSPLSVIAYPKRGYYIGIDAVCMMLPFFKLKLRLCMKKCV